MLTWFISSTLWFTSQAQSQSSVSVNTSQGLATLEFGLNNHFSPSWVLHPIYPAPDAWILPRPCSITSMLSIHFNSTILYAWIQTYSFQLLWRSSDHIPDSSEGNKCITFRCRDWLTSQRKYSDLNQGPSIPPVSLKLALPVLNLWHTRGDCDPHSGIKGGNGCDLPCNILELLCTSWPPVCPFQAPRGLLKDKLPRRGIVE